MNIAVNPDLSHAGWSVGAAETDISPEGSVFLYGYPHVPRMSSGVHDPLLASAIWIEGGGEACLFVGCDLIWVPRPVTRKIRSELSRSLGLPIESIMVTATHTHSGPVTNRMLSNTADPVVPEPDAGYVEKVAQGVIDAAARAKAAAQPATLSFAEADGAGLGGNRRDPDGPSIPQVPLLFASAQGSGEPIAVMAICAVHPTVLHEDSTVISGDFPGLARRALQQRHFGPATAYLHHMGVSGNQSPRRAVRANTLDEAQRLGDLLADRIAAARADAQPIPPQPIVARSLETDLPLRDLPSTVEAEAQRDRARAHLEHLRRTGADHGEVRTAECDWFGAEETVTLAHADRDGRLVAAAEELLPAEIQAIRLGPHTFVGWPGEVFVEFALDVMTAAPRTYIITLANSDLQGYLVTQEAVDERAYEAGNAIFASPASGRRFVDQTMRLLDNLPAACGPTP